MNIKKYYNIGKKELFPICRSLTGSGTLNTLKIIKKKFPKIKIKSIKSGTKAFDWKVPPEWNVVDAFVLDKNKNKIIDFKINNLHLVGYSLPVNKYIKKKELLDHLHSIPKLPNAIPYVTSYYKKYWGFCIDDKTKAKIKKKYKDNEKFFSKIETSYDPNGKLNYGELIIKGKSSREIIISTYICHPSMANDNLSGTIVAMGLIDYFQKQNLKKTMRFIFVPETIGSIAYLSKNLKKLKDNTVGGYNLTCIGDEGGHSCLLSKYEDSPSDRSLIETYKKLNIKYKKYSFLQRGSDERQYNSPGIDLPITSIFRSKYGEYKEYHTSMDNFKLVTIKGINGGFKVAKEAIKILQNKIIPQNKILCEPQMGKRGLYPTLSKNSRPENIKNFMNFLQYSDGKNDLDTISSILNIKKKEALKIYRILKKSKIIS